MSTLNVTNISDGTNSTATTNVVKGSAKAWVNFNGIGTVAIREAYNVGSITDNGTGLYTLNFTTALDDANYCFVVGVERDNDNSDGVVGLYSGDSQTKTASALGIKTGYATTSSGIFDAPTVCVSVFR